ncbi:hypothetical protein KDE13_07500 [Campylobacter sp. faydin G-140]|uniref:hypothetical protein n=1 Tax=Campylobacter anatolicus TaxID=2829105 RepID=UPI001BA0D144|nr:hypothetical protein [Campylobacter anatolicus]MBR8466182.1 hypothetical protein [Campylobacter anatolicus]
MAFYNPNRVDFNPNNGIIGAVGKVGDALWDIYKTNVEKNRNQARLDETARHNESVEKHAADNLAATNAWRQTEKENADRAYQFSIDRFNAETDLKNRQLNEEIARQKEQNAFNNEYKNVLLDLKRGEITRKQQEINEANGGLSPFEYFNNNKDNKQFMAMFGGLDENTGQIDLNKAGQNFANYINTNRMWGKNITDKLNKDDGFDKEMTQILDGANKLNAVGQKFRTYGKELDNYDGLIDRVGDWWQEKSGKDNGSQSARDLTQMLTNAGVQLAKMGRADREIQDLSKELGVSLNGVIFDNDTALKARRLSERIFDTTIGDLANKKEATKDPYQRYIINEKIKNLTEQKSQIMDAIYKPSGESNQNFNWQSVNGFDGTATTPKKDNRPPLDKFFN